MIARKNVKVCIVQPTTQKKKRLIIEGKKLIKISTKDSVEGIRTILKYEFGRYWF